MFDIGGVNRVLNANSSNDDVGAFCLLCLEELYNGNISNLEKLIEETKESGQFERVVAHKGADGKTLATSINEYYQLFYSQHRMTIANEARYSISCGLTPFHSARHVGDVLKLHKAVSAT